MPPDRVCPVIRVRPHSRVHETLLLWTLCLVVFAVTCMFQLESSAEEDDTWLLDYAWAGNDTLFSPLLGFGV